MQLSILGLEIPGIWNSEATLHVRIFEVEHNLAS